MNDRSNLTRRYIENVRLQFEIYSYSGPDRIAKSFEVFDLRKNESVFFGGSISEANSWARKKLDCPPAAENCKGCQFFNIGKFRRWECAKPSKSDSKVTKAIDN